MEFEADPVKAAQNFKKHKVSFEEGCLDFWRFDGVHFF